MPIGKDSIKTRVAKVSAADTTDTAVEALVREADPAAEVKTEAKTEAKPQAKKPTAPRKSAASKADTAAPKAPAKKKTAASKAEAPAPQAAPAEPAAVETAAVETAAVDTAVLANVAPETVEAVVGHKEDAKVEHVQVGQKMPNYLL